MGGGVGGVLITTASLMPVGFYLVLRPIKKDVAFVKQKLNLFLSFEKEVRGGGENSRAVNAKYVVQCRYFLCFNNLRKRSRSKYLK